LLFRDYDIINLEDFEAKLVFAHCDNIASLFSSDKIFCCFSKKLENHLHMLSIYFVPYNFVRMHNSLRKTPAMAAGVTDKLHDMAWLVEVIDAAAPAPKPRGPYKKKETQN
jgi:hypothetical protein